MIKMVRMNDKVIIWIFEDSGNIYMNDTIIVNWKDELKKELQ